MIYKIELIMAPNTVINSFTSHDKREAHYHANLEMAYNAKLKPENKFFKRESVI